MGSEITTAIIEQKGQQTTNPGGLSPEVSRPIEQIDATPSTSSEPIQQILELSTAGGSLSRPIEQAEPDSFNKNNSNPNDCFIEQKNVSRSSNYL